MVLDAKAHFPVFGFPLLSLDRVYAPKRCQKVWPFVWPYLVISYIYSMSGGWHCKDAKWTKKSLGVAAIHSHASWHFWPSFDGGSKVSWSVLPELVQNTPPTVHPDWSPAHQLLEAAPSCCLWRGRWLFWQVICHRPIQYSAILPVFAYYRWIVADKFSSDEK